ncbi:bifunctional 3-phenylpropionate/cinnamic acid dioxygenase ferredoxin subunit [Mycolicibacterium elephantis]|uniref:bifunctional 3-phenylpropionate/cinnamic acid dioxygenase ferredoxin subunit n=1 Tax=Mycolicibacterium elephantis TaxID=81858 RepID=UPI000A94CE1F|nr:bifunctional 3-phenylpropionate/cinnamic acid dioxygenase ferredoxin subunit [Mycolicibacterium elephantis]
MAMTWIRVCAAEDIAPGEALSVDVNAPIAVFNIDGEFLATGEMCTHAEASLAEDGYIEGAEVECSWHMARFCLRTGKALSPPATEPLATYATKVENGQVFIDVP